MIKNRFHSCLKKRYEDNNNQRINIDFNKAIKKLKILIIILIRIKKKKMMVIQK